MDSGKIGENVDSVSLVSWIDVAVTRLGELRAAGIFKKVGAVPTCHRGVHGISKFHRESFGYVGFDRLGGAHLAGKLLRGGN